MIVRVAAGMAPRHVLGTGGRLRYYRRAGAPMTMLYESYQAQDDLLGPWRSLAVAGGEVLRELPVWLLEWPVARVALAGAEMAPLTALRHTRRPFAIESVQVGGRQAAVHEDAVSGSSFGTLLRFAKTPHIDQPRVLLLAPLSG